MRNKDYDEEILNLIKSSPKGYSNVIKNNKEKKYLLNYIVSETPRLDNENLNISTRIYWLLNDITEFPKCKMCGKELPHKNVNPLIGPKKYCSVKCQMNDPDIRNVIDEKLSSEETKNIAREKTKHTCMKKYNSTSPLASKEIQEKIRLTNIERYGVDNPIKTIEVQNKIKETNLERYGVENVFSSKEVQEKIKETNLKRYGFENPNKSEYIKEKIANTNLEKYGVRSFSQTEKCRTGYEEYISDESNRKHIREKMKETSLERYGFNSIDKLNGWNTILSWKDYIVPLFDKDEFNNCGSSYEHIFKWKCVKCGNTFESKIYKTAHNDEFHSLPRCLICYPYMSGFSKKEKEVLEYVKEIYDGKIIENDRTILKPNEENNWKKNHEIDIYLPEINFGIEFNGTYFHSDEESKRNDIFKRIQCEENGIDLLTILEDEWDTDKEKIKKLILNKINFII